MDRLEKILAALCESSRAVTSSIGQDTCIDCTRMAIDVLSRFGIRTYPLAVRLTVWNDVLVAWAEEHGRLPANDKEREDCFEKGGYSVGVGFGMERGADGKLVTQQNPKKWPGHLVAVAENKYLIDLTTVQAARPQHGLDLPPAIYAPMPPDFPSVESDMSVAFPQPGRGDAVAVYVSRPGAEDYRETGGWKRQWPGNVLVEGVLADVRRQLARGERCGG